MERVLACGLGGGLDVVNALPFYFGAVKQGYQAELGSIRPAPVSAVSPGVKFADNGTWVWTETVVKSKGRFAEPRLSGMLDRPVAYFARRYKSDTDVARLTDALRFFHAANAISTSLFVDGGGDSLILRSEDATESSEHSDPFAGGDAEALAALEHIPQAVLAVVAHGLDIRPEAFQANVAELDRRGGYMGWIDLTNGLMELGSAPMPRAVMRYAVPEYQAVASQVLAWREEQLNEPGRLVSHTGTVLFHALAGRFGLQRTFVPWEPKSHGGEPGVVVKREHARAYFFKPKVVQDLKRRLNGR